MFRTSPVHHQERFVQAVFADLVCGNTRTTRHVQPFSTYVSSTCFGPHRSIIRSVLHKLYSQICYVVIRVLLETCSRCEVVGRTLLHLLDCLY